MIKATSAFTGSAAPSSEGGRRGSPTPLQSAASASLQASQPVARLYVQDNGLGGYVYQLVDVLTGQLLAEVPRERVQELKDVQGYSAGALASAQA